MSEGTKGAESVVSITLEARGDQTEFTLRHSGVPDDEMGLPHKDGWNWILSMLAPGDGREEESAVRGEFFRWLACSQ